MVKFSLFRMITHKYSLAVCGHSMYFRRASYAVKLRYGISKPELETLLSLYHFTIHRGKDIVAWSDFVKQHTGNIREKLRLGEVMKGLFRLAVIGSFEYIPIPGSLCVGISELGYKIITAYLEAVSVFIDNHSKESRLVNRANFRPFVYGVAA